MNKRNKIEKTEDFEQNNLRRKFLKKAVYATPGLIVLGQLSKPTNANANCPTASDCPYGPGGNTGGGTGV